MRAPDSASKEVDQAFLERIATQVNVAAHSADQGANAPRPDHSPAWTVAAHTQRRARAPSAAIAESSDERTKAQVMAWPPG
jgi:hypothetical protein